MKLLVHVVGIFGCATAAVATAAPPIAYATVGAGNANEVWLVQPDGSAPVRVYRGPSRISLSNLDVRPGGGQLAFIEGDSTIKVVTYDSSGIALRTDVVPQPAGCRNGGLDFRADGLLLFSQSCNSGTSMSIDEWNGTNVTTVIGNLDAGPFQVRWLRDGSGFLWRVASTPTGQQLRRSDLANPLAWTVIWQMPMSSAVSYIDTAHQSDALLLTWSGVAQVQRYPFSSSGVGSPTPVASGADGHYSPDDTQLAYRVQTRQGWNLMVKGPGGVKAIATGVGVIDWSSSPAATAAATTRTVFCGRLIC